MQSTPAPDAAAAEWQGEIERLAWGGRGMARADDGRVLLLSADGPIFPGERVEARVRWKARHGEGVITNWLLRDAGFDAERYAAFPAAGYELWAAGEHAAELKRQMAVDLLNRSLPETTRWQWLPAPADALRQRIQLHWDGERLGYHRRGSNQVVAAQSYPVAVPEIENAVRLMSMAMQMSLPGDSARWELATGTPPGDLLVWRSARPESAWLISNSGLNITRNPLLHRLGSWQLRQSAGSFFQACPPWAFTAFGSVLAGWQLGGATLYDLYGGVGFFSAMLAACFKRFVLVESGTIACADARANLAGMPIELIEADVEAWLPAGLGTAEDLILLDPPRTGLTAETSVGLQSAGAGRLVLIGCDGAAFQRDVKRLAPRWTLRNLAVIDLFPYSYELEFVALLV